MRVWVGRGSDRIWLSVVWRTKNMLLRESKWSELEEMIWGRNGSFLCENLANCFLVKQGWLPGWGMGGKRSQRPISF